LDWFDDLDWPWIDEILDWPEVWVHEVRVDWLQWRGSKRDRCGEGASDEG